MAKIVVLDDQSEICELIKSRLQLDGHEVKTTNVGDVAIDLGYLFQPDVLITDWNLKSEYNGMEVADAYSVAQENVKTIMISGYAIEEYCDQDKIFEMIFKPFSINKISRAVERALASS